MTKMAMKKTKPIYMTIIVLGTLLAFTLLYLFIFGINSDPFKKSFRDVDYITVKIVSIGDNGDEENKQLVLQNPEQVERLNQLFKQYGYKKQLTTRDQYSYVIQDKDIVNITFWQAGNLLTDCLVSGDKIVVNGTVYNVNSEKAEQKLLIGLVELIATF